MKCSANSSPKSRKQIEHLHYMGYMCLRNAQEEAITGVLTGSDIRYEADKIVVLFDAVGYKTLAKEVVVENDLLLACS